MMRVGGSVHAPHFTWRGQQNALETTPRTATSPRATDGPASMAFLTTVASSRILTRGDRRTRPDTGVERPRLPGRDFRHDAIGHCANLVRNLTNRHHAGV